MSSVGIVHFVANNLLDEVGVNPVWEKIRKYLYAVGVGISLFALYVTLQIKVECAPQYPNGTVIRTDLYSRPVNAYCRNSVSLIIFRYMGCILQASNVAILVSASYWLYYSNVSKPLRTFAKIRGLVNKIHLPCEEMKRQMSYPMKETELSKNPADASDLLQKRKQLREVMKLLTTIEDKGDQHDTRKEREECCCIRIRKALRTCFFRRRDQRSTEDATPLLPSNDVVNYGCCFCDPNIATRYMKRNIILGITCLSIFIALVVILSVLMISKVGTFNCRYDLTAEHVNYICTMDVGSVAIVCTITYALAVFGQMMAILKGLVEVGKVLKTENTKDANVLKLPTLMMINKFYKSSQSSDSEVFSNLIEYFFSEEFEKDVDNNVLTGVISSDSELQKLTGARYTNKNDPILCLPYEFRRHVYLQFPDLIHINNFKLKTYLPLAKKLAEHELWETFISLLDNVEDLGTCSPEDERHFKESIKLHFDSLASDYKEIQRLSDNFYQHSSTGKWHGTHSLLYYATDMKKRKDFQVAIFLLSWFKPMNPYVHYSSGTAEITSEQAMKYVTDPSKSYIRFKDYDDLIRGIRKCEGQSNGGRQHEWAREDMLQQYQSVTPENEASFIERFQRILRRRKFRKWNETASDIFQLASGKNHPDIEIALLRAYFPTDSSSPKCPLSYLCRGGPMPSDTCIDKIIKDLAKGWEYEVEDCKNVVKYLADKYRWELLVGLLNNTKTRCDSPMNEELLLFFKGLEINLKEPSRGFSHSTGNNILYEALNPFYSRLDPKCRFAVANFLLLVSKPQLLDVIAQSNERHSLADEVEQMSVNVRIDDSESFKQALAKFELHYLDEKYNSTTGLDEESIRRIATRRLHQWNSQVHKFACAAAGNSDWEIVISLIQAHIVTKYLRGTNIKIDLEHVEALWKRIVRYQPNNSKENIRHLVVEHFSE